MRLQEIKDECGQKIEVDLDTFTSIKKFETEWYFNFGGLFIPMDVEEGKKLLEDIMKTEECDTTTKPDLKPMVDHSVLDKNYIRFSILNADFLDADSKLKLLVTLGV